MKWLLWWLLIGLLLKAAASSTFENEDEIQRYKSSSSSLDDQTTTNDGVKIVSGIKGEWTRRQVSRGDKQKRQRQRQRQRRLQRRNKPGGNKKRRGSLRASAIQQHGERSPKTRPPLFHNQKFTHHDDEAVSLGTTTTAVRRRLMDDLSLDQPPRRRAHSLGPSDDATITAINTKPDALDPILSPAAFRMDGGGDDIDDDSADEEEFGFIVVDDGTNDDSRSEESRRDLQLVAQKIKEKQENAVRIDDLDELFTVQAARAKYDMRPNIMEDTWENSANSEDSSVIKDRYGASRFNLNISTSTLFVGGGDGTCYTKRPGFPCQSRPPNAFSFVFNPIVTPAPTPLQASNPVPGLSIFPTPAITPAPVPPSITTAPVAKFSIAPTPGPTPAAGGGVGGTTAPTLLPVTPNPTTPQPTLQPTPAPTVAPVTPMPTLPSVTSTPTAVVSETPSTAPSKSPSLFPSTNPSLQPTSDPSTSPSVLPTTVPTVGARVFNQNWFIPQEDSFPPLTAQPGDTIIFTWAGIHNVFIHPTGTCDEEGSILVGTVSPASYVFTQDDVGSQLEFVCDIGSHCESGMRITITVTSNAPSISMSPTALASEMPSSTPTMIPSVSPTVLGSQGPSVKSSNGPTAAFSAIPTVALSVNPTALPSNTPSMGPSAQPTEPEATPQPTATASLLPSVVPTATPSSGPTEGVASSAPSVENLSSSSAPTDGLGFPPTPSPTGAGGTGTSAPTTFTTPSPTAFPTTIEPSAAPSEQGDTAEPSIATTPPSRAPVAALTNSPTTGATPEPTMAPTSTGMPSSPGITAPLRDFQVVANGNIGSAEAFLDATRSYLEDQFEAVEGFQSITLTTTFFQGGSDIFFSGFVVFDESATTNTVIQIQATSLFDQAFQTAIDAVADQTGGASVTNVVFTSAPATDAPSSSPGDGGGGAATPAPTVGARTINQNWFIPAEDSFPPLTAQPGDTIVFDWVGVHNVYIHPTRTCDETGRILVGQESPSSYVFTEADVGQDLEFVCDIGAHCEVGMRVTVTVSGPPTAGTASSPSAVPSQAPVMVSDPPAQPSPVGSPVEVLPPALPSGVVATPQPTLAPTPAPTIASAVPTQVPVIVMEPAGEPSPVGSPIETLPPGLNPAGVVETPQPTPIPTVQPTMNDDFVEPSLRTENPVLASPDPVRRDVTSTFVVSNRAGLDTADLNIFINERFEINDSYNRLAEDTINPYAATRNLEYLWHSGEADLFTRTTCPPDAASDALCHEADASFVLLIDTNFNNDVDAVVSEATALLQNRIDNGDLQCELEGLFPGSRMVVETGGGCSSSDQANSS